MPFTIMSSYLAESATTSNCKAPFQVNDLAFRGFAQRLYDKGRSLAGVTGALLDRINQANRVYLRIGLARPTTVGSYDEACWVQVTGIYTFPDYLKGRIWADFE